MTRKANIDQWEVADAPGKSSLPAPIERRPDGTFAPGHTPMQGRPRGVREKLTKKVLHALLADFEAHGPEAVARCREEDPATYVRVMASLLPKDVKVTHAADGMTVEEIDAEIRRIFDEAAARAAADGRLIEGEAIPPE